jgi:predicted PurR-regulated permease PerM
MAPRTATPAAVPAQPEGRAALGAVPTSRSQTFSIELPWSTILRVCVAGALVWCFLRLTWLFLLVLVAALLAVTLDPLVRRIEARGLPRWLAATLIMLILVGAIVGFAVVASSQLTAQAQVVSNRFIETAQAVRARLPESIVDMLLRSREQSFESAFAPAGLRIVQGLSNALLVFVLAVILTLYLLMEGRATYAWLLAFVPGRQRLRVALTMEQCQNVIFSYVAGNVVTSIFAALFVYASLTLLHVPAALLLSVLAGLCDFVPVIGFAISALPAILLALTVSNGATLTVVVLYAFYHTLENYFLAPYVYGDRLRLSNVVIVLAFAAGAALGGVVGAVVALPIAAAYPAIERIWLRDKLGDKVVDEHATIERQGATADV